ncbi:transferase, partial [Clohesyomyces aquaticus]
VLYFNYCCPWAHRTLLVHGLKGLEDIVRLVEVDSRDQVHGWWFSGRRGPDRDPLYGGRFMKDLYQRADPNYNGRVTVPMLWDTKYETIVNNESSEIMRMFSEAFDDFLPLEKQERNKGDAALVPQHLQKQLDVLNKWVYDTINNGVYKAGFASSQGVYKEHVTRLFQSLDQLEYHLGEGEHYPYLFGEHITEADIRLYPTIVRFDVVYYTLFKCNMKMIRLDYPRIHEWLRRLYWNEGLESAGGVFRKTTNFEEIKRGYTSVAAGNGIIPAGPVPHILPL